MEIRQLENFLEVYKQMSITKAANNMYITQQGMSKSVRSLESELGVPLFIRSGSNIVPTEYARILVRYAEQIDSLYMKALYEIDSLKTSGRTQLRVGIPHGLANILPRELFLTFTERMPNVALSMGEYDDYTLDEMLENGSLDMGFCIEPVPKDKLKIHASHTYKTFYMLSDQHPLAREEYLDLRDLKDESFIGFGDHNKGHEQLVERCLRAGFVPKLGIHTNDMLMLRNLCSMRLGIGFFVGDQREELAGLSVIPDKVPNWNYTVCLCTALSHVLNEAEQAFVEVFSRW